MYCRRGAGCQLKIIAAVGLAEDDSVSRQARGQFAAVAFLDPFDLDIAPMGFTGIINIDIVDTHDLFPLYSIGTKIECRISLFTDFDRCPLPVMSSTSTTSPAPMTLASPSLAVSCTPASRLMMYCRLGAGCHGRSCSAWVWRKMMPVAGSRAEVFPSGPSCAQSIWMSRQCEFAVGVAVKIMDANTHHALLM